MRDYAGGGHAEVVLKDFRGPIGRVRDGVQGCCEMAGKKTGQLNSRCIFGEVSMKKRRKKGDQAFCWVFSRYCLF